MALTRKMLAAMDIPAEKIDEIISAHTETLEAIKVERDSLKSDAEKVKDLEKQLEDATKQLEDSKKGDWEKKYTDLKAEYDTFKSDTEKKETKAKKSEAFKDLLKRAGVSEKRIDAVMKVSADKIDAVTFTEKGEVKDSDKIVEGVKTEWADFITIQREEGADTPHPEGGTGGKDGQKPTRAQELAAKYHENLYGKRKEN